jgi:hypothetical protein
MVAVQCSLIGSKNILIYYNAPDKYIETIYIMNRGKRSPAKLATNILE